MAPEVAKGAGLDSGRVVGAQCQPRHGGHAPARGDQCLLDDDVVAGVRDGRDEARLVAGLEELAAAVLAARDPGGVAVACSVWSGSRLCRYIGSSNRCVALDGTPRSIPDRVHLERHGNRHLHREERAELPALRRIPTVALTIDTESHPPKVLPTAIEELMQQQ